MLLSKNPPGWKTMFFANFTYLLENWMLRLENAIIEDVRVARNFLLWIAAVFLVSDFLRIWDLRETTRDHAMKKAGLWFAHAVLHLSKSSTFQVCFSLIFFPCFLDVSLESWFWGWVLPGYIPWFILWYFSESWFILAFTLESLFFVFLSFSWVLNSFTGPVGHDMTWYDSSPDNLFEICSWVLL